MAPEIGSSAAACADHPQFRLRSLFSAVFWLSILLAATVQVHWPLIPAIVLIWLAALILYQAILGRMDCERATIAILAALGSALPLGLAGLFASDPADPHPVKTNAFEATAWESANAIEGHRTVRSQMIDDLLQLYDVRGWTEDEVIALLGPSDRRPPAMRSFHIVYRLGRQRGAGTLDDEYLYFRLNAQNRVTEFGVTVD